MLKLRLKKLGRKRQPIYKLVIILNNTKRDGKNIESVGFYNPLTKDFFLKKKKLFFG